VKKTTGKRKINSSKGAISPIDPMRDFLSQGRTGEVAYMLRCCDAQMRGHGGFVWPAEGAIEAPDWSPTKECGRGLHGWLWGEGNPGVSDHAQSPEAKWLVCAAWKDDVIDLSAKVKFPRAWVVFCGARDEAVRRIQDLGARGSVIFSTVTGCDDSTVTGGYASTVTGGYASTVTGGYASTVTGGNASTVTGGDDSTVTGGYASTVTGGARSRVTGGARSRVTGGYASTLVIKRWNGKRWKLVVAYVGEDGIEANVPYKLNADGAFVRFEKDAK